MRSRGESLVDSKLTNVALQRFSHFYIENANALAFENDYHKH